MLKKKFSFKKFLKVKKDKTNALGIILALVGLFVFVIVAAAISNLNNQNTSPTIVKRLSGEEYRKDAVSAYINGDNTTARALWVEAKAKFEAEGNQNGIQDAKAQLYLIDHGITAK